MERWSENSMIENNRPFQVTLFRYSREEAARQEARWLCGSQHAGPCKESLKKCVQVYKLTGFVLQEDHAGCRDGCILEIEKTRDKEPAIGYHCNIQARKNGGLKEHWGNGDGGKWSESRDILEAELTVLGNEFNVGEKRKSQGQIYLFLLRLLDL